MAIEVMGWEKDLLGQVRWIMSRNKDRGYIDEYMLLSEWHPDTDLNQAYVCINKYCSGNNYEWYFGNTGGVSGVNDSPIVCRIFGWQTIDKRRGFMIWEKYNKIPALAICEVILEAVGE